MPMRDDRMAGRSYFDEAGFETTAERMPSLEQPLAIALPIEKPATWRTGSRAAAEASSGRVLRGGEGQLPDVRLLVALPPAGDARFALALHMGVAEQGRCVVTWEDSAGEHENGWTLRFF
jgi:hypothetical protein